MAAISHRRDNEGKVRDLIGDSWKRPAKPAAAAVQICLDGVLTGEFKRRDIFMLAKNSQASIQTIGRNRSNYIQVFSQCFRMKILFFSFGGGNSYLGKRSASQWIETILRECKARAYFSACAGCALSFLYFL